ncbi:uncharacterized protein LOC134271368 [Saccostrea cucullata]|uniref:uncharacterized protein LOC134271368 n=1 Tax=Saccostrea cuccullata TaxID=36930 RepID=UPI002ED64BE3
MELKETICPTYMDIASDIQNGISQIEKNCEDLSAAIEEQGDVLHREIRKHVTNLQDEVHDLKIKQLKTLQKHLDEITVTISDIKNEISSIEAFVDYNDITKLLAINLTTTIDKYKNLPQKILPSLPKFTPGKILEEEIRKLFGVLAPSFMTLEKHGYSMRTTQISPEAGSSPPVKQLLDEPETVTTIDTGYENLLNAACKSDEEIWTSGTDNTMKLFSINQRSLLKSITTKSGNKLYDLAVTKNGDLVYTDHMDKTVIIVKNEGIEEIIKTQKWGPYSVCITISFDLLVIMYNVREKQSKVVRYCGSTKKQTIQFDDQGKPLYSMGFYYRHITENRNLDICVSDHKAEVIVVVNQTGKLRFRYTGHTPSPKNRPFSPRGITTDSQSHILTADDNNDCVHIIDQDGQFLCYIKCSLSDPMGLCIDSNDYLFVAQFRNGKVKKIKYLL